MVFVCLRSTVLLCRIVQLYPLDDLGCTEVTSMSAHEQYSGVASYPVYSPFGIRKINSLQHRTVM
jgi:hypothetical protein